MSIIATPLVSRNDVQSVWAAASGQKALASGTLAKSNILKKCDVEYIQQKSNRQKKSWKVSREFRPACSPGNSRFGSLATVNWSRSNDGIGVPFCQIPRA
jgi:hypothetical protein